MRVCVCEFRQHVFVEAYFIKHFGGPLSTYFNSDPFKSLLRCFYYQGVCILQHNNTAFFLYWYIYFI